MLFLNLDAGFMVVNNLQYLSRDNERRAKNTPQQNPLPPNKKEGSFANLAQLSESKNRKVIMQETELVWDL